MRLSEAIRIGCKLRPESRQDRFVWIDNLDELRSDAWGAACEAVQPAVARFNWRDKSRLQHSMDALRAVQQHYFADYFEMPARCPGSQQHFIAQGGRVISNRGEGQIKVYEEGKQVTRHAVTSECDLVAHLAGAIDHMFYAHGWSREQVAEVVEHYENTRSMGFVMQNFNHFSPNVEKYVRTLIKPVAN
jgi:hypothetical protein